MTIKITSAGASARCFASRLQFCKMKFHSRTPCSRVHEEGQRCGRRWPSFCLDGSKFFKTIRSRTNADQYVRLRWEHREGRVAPFARATMQKWHTRKRPDGAGSCHSCIAPHLLASRDSKAGPTPELARFISQRPLLQKYAGIRVEVKLVMLRMIFQVLILNNAKFDYEI